MFSKRNLNLSSFMHTGPGVFVEFVLLNLYFPVKYFGDPCLSTVILFFSFGHCIVCSSSITVS